MKDNDLKTKRSDKNDIDSGNVVKLPCIVADVVFSFVEEDDNFDVTTPKSVYSAEKAVSNGGLAFVVRPSGNSEKVRGINDICKTGMVLNIINLSEKPDGTCVCFAVSLARAHAVDFSSRGNGYTATVQASEPYGKEKLSPTEITALSRELKNIFEAYTLRLPEFPASSRQNIIDLVKSDDPAELYENSLFYVRADNDELQRLLDLETLGEKLYELIAFLSEETDILFLESKIHSKVQDSILKQQRSAYIREQILALQEELNMLLTGADDYEDEFEIESDGAGDNFSDGELPEKENEFRSIYPDTPEMAGYRQKLREFHNMNRETAAKLNEEIDKLAKIPTFSQEYALLSSYIELCLSLPWDNKTKDSTDIIESERILDEDHYGLAKVKNRILEILSVRALTPDIKGQIICLAGPPGTGKTSIAKSIAKALNRKYVKVSLGGVSDESDIRGHRKTYLGSMPGRILTAMKQGGVLNPVMLLDEIDKMTCNLRGDPTAALLEVLDSEQNSGFRDHYAEVPFDLSDVMFIATANNLENIPAPLLDRLEIIELSSYTREEKFHIAKEHLIRKQLEKNGIKRSQLRICDSAVYSLIDHYTKEAGVRKLEREIASLCRKAARRLVAGEEKVVIKANNLEEFLGTKKYTDDFFSHSPTVGCVNGLAWTSVGGVIMPLEAVALEGKGKIELTGSLGDVMKESAKLAVSNARRLSKKYGIDPAFYEKQDIHIHAPEGAVPKDGPSAGVTMITALISALSNSAVRSDIAMTGEITLGGNVLPIGGLKEKSIAAYKNGIKTVIIPEANKPEIDEIDEAVRQTVEFIPVKNVEEVLDLALISDKAVKRKTAPRKNKTAAERV